MNDKKQIDKALALAERGFYVFPIHPETLRPLDKAWPELASNDPDRVRRMWIMYPKAGIAAHPGASGHWVADIDTKKSDGEAAWRALLDELGVVEPATFTTLTKSFGRHLWFKGVLPNSVSKLAEGVDIRSHRGFVVMPGTGSYLEVGSDTVAEFPAFAEIKKRLEAADLTRSSDHEVDEAAAYEAARKHLSILVNTDRIARAGSQSDTLYKLGARLRDMGVSLEAAADLASEIYAPHCQPPIAPDDLHNRFKNAYQYAQNEEGCDALPPALATGDQFANIDPGEIPEPEETKTKEKPRYYPYCEAEQDRRAEPSWLIPGLIGHGTTSFIYGKPGSLKSFIALDMALSIAAGHPALGLDYEAHSFPVLYVAPEGLIGIEKRRRPAWRKENNIEGDLPFWTVAETPMAGDKASWSEFMTTIEKYLGDKLPRLIIIDTLARAMSGMDENSAQDMGRFADMMAALSKRYSCAVVAIHHSTAGGERERGSSALRGAVDSVFRVERDGQSVALYNAKQKDFEEHKPITFSIHPCHDSLVLKRQTGHNISEKFESIGDSGVSTLGQEVSRALKSLGAHDLATGVSSATLASELLEQRDDEFSGDEYVRARNRLMRSLNAHAKAGKKLEGFVLPDITPLVWTLPEQIEE